MTDMKKSSNEQEERIIEIEIERLRPFKEHPFQVNCNDGCYQRRRVFTG